MAPNNNGIQFSKLFTPAHILCGAKATTRNELFMELLRKLAYETGIGNVDDAYQGLLDRETDFPSIIGPQIAVPHARLEAINELVVGIATCENGIRYAEGQDDVIRLFIMILAPKARPGLYLQALSSLAKICQEPTTAGVVADLQTPEEIWKFFDRGGLVLPNYLLACDIMDKVTVKLHENDTLEKAIDLFVRHGRLDLPVVDKEDELIGVVTTYELLKVCLPDYILWMDDLTPILNFEPFAEILRNENKTWLAEIMTSEYAAVSADAPAIQIAKELTRQRADHAYIIRGKKLVGVSSLESLMRKILRE